MAGSKRGADGPRDAQRARRRRPSHEDGPVLPERAAEDRDESWGDAPASRDDDWYRRERPPHHE